MAVASVLSRLRREPLDDLPLAQQVNQLCQQCRHLFRDRLLPPLVTLRLFLLQVLHGNTSIAHLRQLAGLDFAPGSYCEARHRLPLQVILSLLEKLNHWANAQPRAAGDVAPCPAAKDQRQACQLRRCPALAGVSDDGIEWRCRTDYQSRSIRTLPASNYPGTNEGLRLNGPTSVHLQNHGKLR